MATMTKRLREVACLVSKAGGELEGRPAISAGTHVCVMVKAGNGAMRKFFTSFTPGDRRGALNFVADVRNWCRQNSRGMYEA